MSTDNMGKKSAIELYSQIKKGRLQNGANSNQTKRVEYHALNALIHLIADCFSTYCCLPAQLRLSASSARLPGYFIFSFARSNICGS